MATKPGSQPERLDLGEHFSLCPRTRQLCNNDEAVKLERIPLEILLLLAQRRGEVVSRDEIVERIWGKNVFLDTDNSIRGAIRKIRQVLHDDPEQPRFIQTVTGTGYRLIPPPVADVPPTPPKIEAAPPDITAPRKGSRWGVVTGVALLIVFSAVVFGLYRVRHRPKPGSTRIMIAVLPFENLTGDPAQEYFADGFTEEMITKLGQLDSHRMGVIARTSVIQYKRTQKQIREIGSELGVQYALEGSVRRDADRVRITAQLIRVDDQTHLWAREYDRELSGVLQLETEIAQEIASEIQVALGSKPALQNAATEAPANNYAAYDSYLKGRYYWNKRTREGFLNAVTAFNEAIRQDPNYARAYAGLADTYAMMSSYTLGRPDEYMPKAKAAAEAALRLNEGLAEAHTAMAIIAENYEWDWKKSDQEYQRAIELNPNYATAHHWYAESLSFRGRFEEAMAESDRARRLDPLSLIIASDDGAIYYYARQYDRAIERFRSVLKADPSFGRGHLIIGALVEQGKIPEALAEIDRWEKLQPGPWIWQSRAIAYARAGEPRKAEQAAKQMLEACRTFGLDPTTLQVTVEAALGRNDRAIELLEKAYREHSNMMVVLAVDPGLDRLRDDPRFKDLLRRVGLSDLPIPGQLQIPITSPANTPLRGTR